MDSIILLDDGKVTLHGNYDEIKENEIFLKFTQSSVARTADDSVKHGDQTKDDENKNDKASTKLIEEEERQDGRVSLLHYIHYIRDINTLIFIVILLLYLAGEAIMVGCNLILTKWTDKTAEQFLTMNEHFKYITMYGGLNGAMCLVSFIYNIWTYLAMTKPSKKMHDNLLKKTMHAPLSFFEANPSGRIINRFTSDMETVDTKIPFEMADFIYCSVNFFSVCITISVIVPYILIALVPILAAFVLLQMLLARTRCQIKRYESVAKAPIISHFTETILGVTTIRAFREEQRFQEEFEEKLSKHLRTNYINDMMNRWLSVRVDFLGNGLIFLVSILTFTLRDNLSPGLAGMAITYSMMVMDSLAWMIRMQCDLETNSVAIERIREYDKIEQEDEWELKNVPDSWPENAQLSIQNVNARYRENLPYCLENLSLQLISGEKLGVCGRTGAGKSSLASLLLRIVQPWHGMVKLSGINTRDIGLQQLRSKITIVPQV